MDSAGAPPSRRRLHDPEASPSSRKPSTDGVYRIIWRWHFYAGILVAPVLLVVSITGALYIFRSEIEDLWFASSRFVEPSGSRIGAQAQVDAAKAAYPRLQPTALTLAAETHRASIVRLGENRRRGSVTVHVDPYRGTVLGAVESEEEGGLVAAFDAVLKLHREIFLGTSGRIIVELTTGWTILLLVTGLYLWWPRHRGRSEGVWLLRLRAKPYTVLRDLHTVLGFYLLVPMMVIVATGLFYTIVWSEAFHFVTRSSDRSATARREVPTARAEQSTDQALNASAWSLDRVEAWARERYPGRILSFDLAHPKARGIQVTASNDYNRPLGPYVSAQFALDRASGELISHTTLAENERYWWHGWVYPLHVGSVLGIPTKVVWLVACLLLIALPITGLWMWWIRRPRGRTGFPRRPERRLPIGLFATIVALSIALPIVGASIALILLGEGMYGLCRGLRSRRRVHAS